MRHRAHQLSRSMAPPYTLLRSSLVPRTRFHSGGTPCGTTSRSYRRPVLRVPSSCALLSVCMPVKGAWYLAVVLCALGDGTYCGAAGAAGHVCGG